MGAGAGEDDPGEYSDDEKGEEDEEPVAETLGLGIFDG